MLRRLTAKNVVSFRRGIDITFQQGANFLIGRCATGKSAALELIRRCHHDNINVSTISTISDITEKAYAFCLYDSIEGFENLNIKTVLTGIYVDPSFKESGHKKKLIYKIAVLEYVEYEFSNCFVYGKLIEDSDTADGATYFKFRLSESQTKDLNPPEINDAKFCRLIDLVKQKLDGDTCLDSCDGRVADIDIDGILAILLKQFAATMPHRGISPVMWTGQLANRISDKEKLCLEAMSRADILRTLLNDSDNVDQSKADDIYRCLSPENFKFEKEGDKIFVIDPSGTKVPLIRAPTGVYESKQLSLLLAHKKMKTLCLEEPSRGMHQDMIKKFGQLILPRLTDKTVVIVSHEKAIVSPYSLERTYIFKNSCSDYLVCHEVMEFPHCCIKFGLDEEMKTVLFSDSVLLVEGDTDRIILQALFHQIVSEQKPERLQNVLIEKSSKLNLAMDVIEKTFARIDIVTLGGDKAGLDRQKFCKLITIPCILLLDRIAITEKREFPCRMKSLYVTEESFGRSVKIETENEWNSQYENISKYLGKKDIFVWKEGDIEDVFLSQIPSEDEIYSKMELSQIVREGGDKETVKKNRKSWKSKLISHSLGDVNQLVISGLGENNKETSLSLLIEFLLRKFCR